MRTMHLFAGGGGSLFGDKILGNEPIVAVELDRECCDELRDRKKEGWFPDCEIIERDICSFDGAQYAGRVGGIHAGWPCQNISGAGPGGGLDGDRSGLFFEVVRIVDEVGQECEKRGIQKPLLFLENSPNVTIRGFGRVGGALADCGYDIRWLRLRASDVGAHHNRLRWWGFAYPNGFRHSRQGHDWENTRYKSQGFEWETSGAINAIRGGSVPAMCGDHNGMAQTESYLKMLGNGVVPLAYAYAWVMLGGPTEVNLCPE